MKKTILSLILFCLVTSSWATTLQQSHLNSALNRFLHTRNDCPAAQHLPSINLRFSKELADVWAYIIKSNVNIRILYYYIDCDVGNAPTTKSPFDKYQYNLDLSQYTPTFIQDHRCNCDATYLDMTVQDIADIHNIVNVAQCSIEDVPALTDSTVDASDHCSSLLPQTHSKE